MAAGQLGPIPVVVVHTHDDRLFALVDRCLHQGGALSRGRFGFTSSETSPPGEYRVREGMVLQCPWHGYEYDVCTGCLLADPHQKLRMFKVAQDGADVVVSM